MSEAMITTTETQFLALKKARSERDIYRKVLGEVVLTLAQIEAQLRNTSSNDVAEDARMQRLELLDALAVVKSEEKSNG